MRGVVRNGQGFDSLERAEFRQPPTDAVSHYIHVQDEEAIGTTTTSNDGEL